MHLKRGSEVEHYRLVGGRHLELAGTWPSIPIDTSATQITRYVGLALSMALLAAFLLPQRSQAASNPADKENKQDLAPLILSPTSNSTITGSTVVFQILPRGRDSDQFTALLDGLDVTFLFKKGKGRTRRAQVSPAELHLGSNHFKVTVGRAGRASPLGITRR